MLSLKRSTVFSLLFLISSNSALAGPANSFCGRNALPTVSDCEIAISRIDTSATIDGGTVISAGDCTVEVKRKSGTDAGTISGSDFRAQAEDIVTDGCLGDGWCQDSGLNVTVHQCTVCGPGGACTVCNAPRRRSLVPDPRSLPTERDILKTSNAPHITTRQTTSPDPFLTCGATLGPVDASDCHDLASSLRGQSLSMPFNSVSGDCELAIFGHVRDLVVNGDDVAFRIDHDTDICSQGTGGVVGRQDDKSQDIVLVGYEIWFGQLCGQFGFGNDGCTP